MKKFLSMMLAIVLVLAVATPVFATADGGNAAVSNGSARVGQVATVTISLSGLADASSVAVKFSIPEGLEFDASQSEWLIDGDIEDISEGKAALALNEAVPMNGDVLKLAFKIKDSVEAASILDIAYTVQVKAYNETICTETLSGEVWANPFTDVKASNYYHDAVKWAVSNNITSGTTDTTFSPSNKCTRAQVVTFLWAAAGRPEPKTSNNPFSDVKVTNYYYKAVLWAVENNITSGTTATTFSPSKTCTRAQVMTFLWAAANRPEPETTANPFSDVKSTNYYYNAVLWAVENGITSGTGDGTTFGSTNDCTRAHVMTFLYGMIVKQGIEISVGK